MSFLQNLKPFQIVRLVCFGIVLLFALIVFAISANLLAKNAGLFTTAPAFALAIGILTWLVILPVVIIDFLRKGAPSGWVGVEIGWVSLFNIFWLATSAHSTIGLAFIGLTTRGGSLDHSQPQAVQALSWLNWLILLGYEATLITFAIIAYSRGNKAVFTSSTMDTDFLAPAQTQFAGGITPMGQYPQQTGGAYPQQGYPQQPQQQMYPQQTGGSFPPQQGGFPPQQGGFPQQQGGFPQQQGGFSPQQPQQPQLYQNGGAGGYVSPAPTGGSFAPQQQPQYTGGQPGVAQV